MSDQPQCTDHCWHVSGEQHTTPNHVDLVCCWCAHIKCHRQGTGLGTLPHGPHVNRAADAEALGRNDLVPRNP